MKKFKCDKCKQILDQKEVKPSVGAGTAIKNSDTGHTEALIIPLIHIGCGGVVKELLN